MEFAFICSAARMGPQILFCCYFVTFCHALSLASEYFYIFMIDNLMKSEVNYRSA